MTKDILALFSTCIILFASFMVVKVNVLMSENTKLITVVLSCINEHPIMLKAPKDIDTVVVLCKRA